jgi:hypothetical protein
MFLMFIFRAIFDFLFSKNLTFGLEFCVLRFFLVPKTLVPLNFESYDN